MSGTVGAVLLDALGTLVELEPPAPALRAELEHRTGTDVGAAAAEAAFAAEIAYYLAHHLEGRDRDSVERLRDRCAEELRGALELEGLDHATAREAMLAALRFRPFADALPLLKRLRADGLRVVVLSNWDASLPEALERAGLARHVDAAVSSAVAGAAKPHPVVFERALAVAGCEPAEAVHVGDSPAADVAGARAAGIRAVLLDRAGGLEAPRGVRTIASLAELPAKLA